MPRRDAGGAASRAAGSAAGAARSRGSAAASLLPASLRTALQQLPRVAEELLGKQRGRPTDALGVLEKELRALPSDCPPHAAALAELLSTHSDAAKALLRLHAAALRQGEGAGQGSAGEHSGGGSGSGGNGGKGGSGSSKGLVWDVALSAAVCLPYRCLPLPPSRHALTVLRFVRAMLRGQTLHAFSRRLAAAASALESASKSHGSESGASAYAVDKARTAFDILMDHLSLFFTVLLLPKEGPGAPTHIAPPPELVAAVASERAAGVEELARGLAESSVLEHAARVLLLLQARGPHAVRPQVRSTATVPREVCDVLFQVAKHVGAFYVAKEDVESVSGLQIGCNRPAAGVMLRTALSGRCVQTAVLVYGVGTLRLVDRGPTYGLPAALQTAGLAMCDVGKREGDAQVLRLLLGQLGSSGALPPPGPGGSLELALRVGRAAVSTAWWQHSSAIATDPSITPPPRPAVPLALDSLSAVRLAVAALTRGRELLPAQDATPQRAERRVEWWELAVSTLVFGFMRQPRQEAATLRRLMAGVMLRQVTGLMVAPIIATWPDCRLGKHGRWGRQTWTPALPAEPPAEVAAALAGGLLRGLVQLNKHTVRTLDTADPAMLKLLAACDRASPGGGGFTLFLVPLLAYGEPEQVGPFLETIGLLGGLVEPADLHLLPERSLGRQLGAFAAALPAKVTAPVREAAAAFLAAADAALATYWPTVTEASRKLTTPAQKQLSDMVSFALELWRCSRRPAPRAQRKYRFAPVWEGVLEGGGDWEGRGN